MSKPIRVFWSPLSQRFYASRAYKEDPRGFVTITGEQFDVTDDIASLILKNDITFTKEAAPNPKSEKPMKIKVAWCSDCGRKIRKVNGDWEHVWSSLMSCYRDSIGLAATPKKGTVKTEAVNEPG